MPLREKSEVFIPTPLVLSREDVKNVRFGGEWGGEVQKN